MLAAAFGLLRWPPDAVWRATPREIAWALGAAASSGPPSQDQLKTLMADFPDR